MRRTLPTLVVGGIILSACHSKYVECAQGSVSFVHAQRWREVLSEPEATPASVLISIEDDAGRSIEKNRKFSLSVFRSFMRDKMDLHTGSYKITQFAVLDASDNFIYITPQEGSELACYVSDPLPLNFTISESDHTLVILQVLAIAEADDPRSLGVEALSFR